MTKRKPADRAPRARTSSTPKTTPLPPDQMSKAPRCPLCGIVLDLEVRTTIDDGQRVAYFTLTDKSQRHVGTPHTITINDQGEPA